MTKPRRSGSKGPASVENIPVRGSPREPVFGGPAPDGPLPGRLLVLLSRLHRAEAAEPDRRATQRG